MGMSWSRNARQMPRQARHTAHPKSYLFHGTFNPVVAKDRILYDDDFYFFVNVGGHTGQGHLHISGALYQKN